MAHSGSGAILKGVMAFTFFLAIIITTLDLWTFPNSDKTSPLLGEGHWANLSFKSASFELSSENCKNWRDYFAETK